MKRIYLDYAASTPVDPLVVDAMEPFWNENFGNSNALHAEGRVARKAIEDARATIAGYIGARDGEVIFTGSGTEANVLSLRGMLSALRSERTPNKTHVITTNIEHSSVLDCYKSLELEGYRVTIVPVDISGVVDASVLCSEITEDTVMVSVMHANNEIGTRQPLEEISKRIKLFQKNNKTPFPYFHTDASQAPLFDQINVNELGVDMLTVDAQKIYGPKGVGALYVRTGTPIAPLCNSGNQEKGVRPGTVNTPCVVGFAKAYELAESRRTTDVKNMMDLRDHFKNEIERAISGVVFNGDMKNRLENNLSLSIPGFESEYIQTALDEAGVAASTSSACLSGGEEGSYVVEALGAGNENESIRFTIGRETTKDEIDRVVSILKDIISK